MIALAYAWKVYIFHWAMLSKQSCGELERGEFDAMILGFFECFKKAYMYLRDISHDRYRRFPFSASLFHEFFPEIPVHILPISDISNGTAEFICHFLYVFKTSAITLCNNSNVAHVMCCLVRDKTIKWTTSEEKMRMCKGTQHVRWMYTSGGCKVGMRMARMHADLMSECMYNRNGFMVEKRCNVLQHLLPLALLGKSCQHPLSSPLYSVSCCHHFHNYIIFAFDTCCWVKFYAVSLFRF